jgi:hypothetical protein
MAPRLQAVRHVLYRYVSGIHWQGEGGVQAGEDLPESFMAALQSMCSDGKLVDL